MEGSENFVEKNNFDLCFTSPPYFDLERYSGEATQSYLKYPDVPPYQEISIGNLTQTGDIGNGWYRNEYDVLLQETISAKLAAELCYAITSSTSLAAQMNELYQIKLREARYVDATEGTPDDIDSSTFINSRY